MDAFEYSDPVMLLCFYASLRTVRYSPTAFWDVFRSSPVRVNFGCMHLTTWNRRFCYVRTHVTRTTHSRIVTIWRMPVVVTACEARVFSHSSEHTPIITTQHTITTPSHRTHIIQGPLFQLVSIFWVVQLCFHLFKKRKISCHSSCSWLRVVLPMGSALFSLPASVSPSRARLPSTAEQWLCSAVLGWRAFT